MRFRSPEMYQASVKGYYRLIYGVDKVIGKIRRKLDEKAESVLETLAHSKPPDGRKRWTLQLLADRLVELKVVDSISHETVRKEAKKREFDLG